MDEIITNVALGMMLAAFVGSLGAFTRSRECIAVPPAASAAAQATAPASPEAPIPSLEWATYSLE